MGQLYTTEELQSMSAEELRVAQANGFERPLSPPEARAQQRIGTAVFGEGYTNPAQPSSPQDPYAPTSWGTDLYDFRAPSGQLCQMRKLKPEALVGTDLLDKITRLPAFADEAIRQAEGQPPTADKMPSKEDLAALISVLDELLPMVVVQPTLWPNPDPKAEKEEDRERVSGRVYVSDVDLVDRVAIMEKAMEGVAKMDNFRKES